MSGDERGQALLARVRVCVGTAPCVPQRPMRVPNVAPRPRTYLKLSAPPIELERSEALQAGVNRYVFVCLHELAQRAACTHFHIVEARLARHESAFLIAVRSAPPSAAPLNFSTHSGASAAATAVLARDVVPVSAVLLVTRPGKAHESIATAPPTKPQTAGLVSTE